MTLRIGLIGRGPWGRNIEKALLSLPDVSVSVVARSEAAPCDIDGVVIATASASHAEVALPYIEAAIPTFIEKPLATNSADAKRICAAAERAGATVFVGHIQLHNPAFVALLDTLSRMGAIRMVTCHGMNDRPRADSSVLWDWLPHHLSMALAIFRQPPDRVAATALAGAPETQSAVATFTFGDKPLISTVSWLSPIQRRTMRVETENGTVIFDDKSERKLTVRQGSTVSYPPYDGEPPLTRELRLFTEAIRSGATDRSQALQGAAIVRMIAAAEHSIAQGGIAVEIEAL
jgi:predicted dehydrogenase